MTAGVVSALAARRAGAGGHRGPDPDRRSAQPRQLRRSAGLLGPARWSASTPRSSWRAGICFAVASNTAAVCAGRALSHGQVSARLDRRRPAARADPAPARRSPAGLENKIGRAVDHDRAGWAGRARRACWRATSRHRRRASHHRRRRPDPRARSRPDRSHAQMDVLRMGRLRAVDIHPIERKPSRAVGFSARRSNNAPRCATRPAFPNTRR